MALSIFSSEKRVGLTILSAIVLIIPLMILNTAVYWDLAKGKDGTEAEKKFWRSKVLAKQKYDMVFVGDSRTLCGIDPAVFDKVVGNRSFNGAFTGGSINLVILEHVESNLLAASGKHRAVILGVTPMCMSNQSRGNSHYNGLKNSLKSKENAWSEAMEIVFGEIRTKDIKELLRKRKPDKIYHTNGWMEKISEVKPKARRSNLAGYKIYFNDIFFSEESMQEILLKVKQWKKQNITVFAFRMPSFPDMEKLENDRGKCDFKLFQKRLEAAGGVWLAVKDRNSYNSYDGAHLERYDANKLSADLAEQIKAYFIK